MNKEDLTKMEDLIKNRVAKVTEEAYGCKACEHRSKCKNAEGTLSPHFGGCSISLMDMHLRVGMRMAYENPAYPWIKVCNFMPGVEPNMSLSLKVIIRFKSGEVDFDRFNWKTQKWVDHADDADDIVAWMYIPEFEDKEERV